MKYYLLVISLIFNLNCWGQTYQSIYTIHLPQEVKEDIQRTLTFTDEYVHIASQKDNQNVNNQVWQIHNHWEVDETLVYHLISLDESHSIRMYIKKENFQYIEVHQPTEDGGIQRLHLILENLK